MLTTPPVVAVIGAVESPLLTAWTTHYRALGVERFHLAFHFPDHVPEQRRRDLAAACRQLGVTPAAVSTGPWHEHTNTHLRDTLRQAAGSGWHLLADADELHTYPAPLHDMVSAAEESGHRVVGGLLLDRVAVDGRLAPWRAEDGLDHAFPLGGHLTHRVLGGDPRKIVLVQSGVAVASGNHRAPGHKPDRDALAVVHHVTWRAGVLDDLWRRVEKFTSGAWAEHTPAVRGEAGRLLEHVARNGGRIDVADPRLAFCRVTLAGLPAGCAAEARAVTTRWRPPAAQ